MEDCEYYIHDIFIAKNCWQESAWNGLMSLVGHAGWTLDVVLESIQNFTTYSLLNTSIS